MNTEYTFHHDAGHGWLEVPISELEQLNIITISPYSYISDDGRTASLEEDCDLAVFLAARGRENVTILDKYDGRESFIRNRRAYSPKLHNTIRSS